MKAVVGLEHLERTHLLGFYCLGRMVDINFWHGGEGSFQISVGSHACKLSFNQSSYLKMADRVPSVPKFATGYRLSYLGIELLDLIQPEPTQHDLETIRLCIEGVALETSEK
ncbi:hypothetical protein [Roseibium sp. M-1]